MYCDLHAHSTASDGTVSPTELPVVARDAGLQAFALTDHDTTTGLAECAAAAEEVGIAFVPGIEISADPGPSVDENGVERRRGTLHILGLFVRHDDPMLLEIEAQMRDARDSRNPAIVDKLQALGVNITYDEVMAVATEQGTQIIGRPHIAQVLINKGYVKSIQDAFVKYIAQGKPAYVRRDRLDPAKAIEAIHHAGGLAILAHPIQTAIRDIDELTYFVARLKDIGLDGIEVQHSDHTAQLAKQYIQLAEELDLLTSGGSDFHGSRKPIEMGSQKVSIDLFNHLRDEWTKRSS